MAIYIVITSYSIHYTKLYELAPSGLPAIDQTIGYLGAGQSTLVTYTFTAPNYSSNTYLPIAVRADPHNWITEINEGNNQGNTGVTVLTRPDLIVSALTTNKSTYNAGETVTVTATITNSGNSPAGTSVVRMAPSNGIAAQTKSIGALSYNFV